MSDRSQAFKRWFQTENQTIIELWRILTFGFLKLKAERPHPGNYSTHRQRPWTDHHPNIDRCVLEIWLWSLTLSVTLTSTFDLDSTFDFDLDHDLRARQQSCQNTIFTIDLDLWPTTLTYNPNLAKVKVNLHTKYQCHRSNGSAARVSADGQKDEHYRVHYLPASQSITIGGKFIRVAPLIGIIRYWICKVDQICKEIPQ